MLPDDDVVGDADLQDDVQEPALQSEPDEVLPTVPRRSGRQVKKTPFYGNPVSHLVTQHAVLQGSSNLDMKQHLCYMLLDYLLQ